MKLLESISSVEKILLSEGVIDIPKVRLSFSPWTGNPLKNDYGSKPVVNFDGVPTFAEIAILKLFQAEGWNGVWVDTYHNRYWEDMFKYVALRPDRNALLQSIYTRAGSHYGCFDIYAWKNGNVMFAEAKRRGKDRIRKTQVRWLAAALKEGVPRESLLIVEWNFG